MKLERRPQESWVAELLLIFALIVLAATDVFAQEAACLDKMLNCSDGDLGDGQIMARGKFYPNGKATPRLVPVP